MHQIIRIRVVATVPNGGFTLTDGCRLLVALGSRPEMSGPPRKAFQDSQRQKNELGESCVKSVMSARSVILRRSSGM
jgi:hypothetical protein